jgi:hypothetical protein
MVDTENFHSRRPHGDLSPRFQYQAAFEFAPESHGRLGAELSEVVVGVEVAEAQALVFGQRAHVWTEPPGDVRRPASETLDKITEFSHVCFQIVRAECRQFFGRVRARAWKPSGQGIGTQSAIHLTRTRGSFWGALLTIFSLINMRCQSPR